LDKAVIAKCQTSLIPHAGRLIGRADSALFFIYPMSLHRQYWYLWTYTPFSGPQLIDDDSRCFLSDSLLSSVSALERMPSL
jgi:hypothetical protein